MGNDYELRIYKRKNLERNKRYADTGRALYSGTGRKITDIVPDTTDLHDYTVIDLHGHYILPGLINMHVHLAGNGKPQKNSVTMRSWSIPSWAPL